VSPEGVERSREHFKDIFGNPDHLHEIALDGKGNVVGVLHVSKGQEGQHLQALYLDKDYHGTGLARVLMDRAIAWCDRSQPIYLEVAIYNERAKAFYRKYHFREIDGTEEYFAEVIPIIRMEREGETV
jgi:GNAT superfamily N-acetyltransferase